MQWEGFVETVPLAFYAETRYENGKNWSMIDLMEKYELKPELLEIAKRRNIEQKEHARIKKETKERDEADKADKEYAQIVSLFAEEGITAHKPANVAWKGGDRYTVETIVDGVPHTLHVMKMSCHTTTPYKQQVRAEAADHFEMLQKYKDTVHAEFKRLQSTHGCTHVMEGGGGQMQAFFCDKKGYICIMYFGMKGSPPVKNWTAHWQRKQAGEKGTDPFAPETFYDGETSPDDINRNKK